MAACPGSSINIIYKRHTCMRLRIHWARMHRRSFHRIRRCLIGSEVTLPLLRKQAKHYVHWPGISLHRLATHNTGVLIVCDKSNEFMHSCVEKMSSFLLNLKQIEPMTMILVYSVKKTVLSSKRMHNYSNFPQALLLLYCLSVCALYWPFHGSCCLNEFEWKIVGY